jgi:Raf kinase inhibitor-like YbhB/YbcL family protein
MPAALDAPLAVLLALAAPHAAESPRLRSPAFEHMKAIPKQYTCDGADASFPLEWGAPPKGTKSIAVVAEDPTVESGSFVHWAIYDLPASVQGLPKGVPRTEKLKSGAHQALNDFGSVGYRGPCPPPGTSHDYWVRVYFLDQKPKLKKKPTGHDVLHATVDHCVRVMELMGRYAREEKK